jgi:hypothetical protein
MTKGHYYHHTWNEETNMKKIQVYSGIGALPSGSASDNITEGCMVLEGGAFRGVYTSGVLDALMEEDINMRCTVGVSAGALNGVNYVTGQIGRSGRINLRYRHDSRYVGAKAIRRNKGIIGFDFVFGDMDRVPPLDKKRFMDRSRQFYIVVTNLKTGRTEYLEKNSGIPPLRAELLGVDDRGDRLHAGGAAAVRGVHAGQLIHYGTGVGLIVRCRQVLTLDYSFPVSYAGWHVGQSRTHASHPACRAGFLSPFRLLWRLDGFTATCRCHRSWQAPVPRGRPHRSPPMRCWASRTLRP